MSFCLQDYVKCGVVSQSSPDIFLTGINTSFLNMVKVDDGEMTCVWVELDRNSLSRSMSNCLVYIYMCVSVAMCVSVSILYSCTL